MRNDRMDDKELLTRLLPVVLGGEQGVRQYSPVYCVGAFLERLEACAWVKKQIGRAGLSVRRINGEDFAAQLIRWMMDGGGHADSFAHDYCGYDALILETPEKLSGKETPLQELFYVLDDYLLRGKPIFVFSEVPPGKLPGADYDVEEHPADTVSSYRLYTQLVGGVTLHLEAPGPD